MVSCLYASMVNLAFLAQFLTRAASFSLPKPSFNPRKLNIHPSLGEVIGESGPLGLTEEEFSQMFRSVPSLDSMHIRSGFKPDCFKQAVTMIKSHCGREDEMEEEDRVAAAISMTMCEIYTAKNQSPPLECHSFSSPPLLSPERESSDLQAACVEALSRSAQFWASYSGYMREVPQLCFVFRRWHDVDLAKNIYRNATLEKFSLLKHMSSRESSLRAAHSGLSAIAMDARMSTESLAKASNHIDDMSKRLGDRLEEIEKVLPNFEKTLIMLEARLLEFAVHQERVLTTRIECALSEVIKQHSINLLNTVQSLDENLQQSGNNVAEFLRMSTESHNIIETRWSELGLAVADAKKALQGSTIMSQQASAHLSHHMKRTWEHHRLLNDLSETLPRITSSLSELPGEVEQHLRSLNHTAWRIQDNWNVQLRRPRVSFFGWFEGTIIQVCAQRLLQVEYRQVETIFAIVSQTLPVFLGLYRICAFLSTFCRTLASIVTKLLAAIFSCLFHPLAKRVRPVAQSRSAGCEECYQSYHKKSEHLRSLPTLMRFGTKAQWHTRTNLLPSSTFLITRTPPPGPEIQDACNVPRVLPLSTACQRSMSLPPY